MAFQEIVIPQIVGIEEADERRFGGCEAAARGPGLSDVLVETDVAEAGIAKLLQRLLDDRDRIVGRGVVDDDRAQVPAGLAGDRFDRPSHEGAVVVVGNHHTDRGR